MTTKDLMIMAAVVAVGLVLWLALNAEARPRYRRRTMLTGSERDFYFHLARALPECLVCPQLAVSALIEPLGVGRARRAALERIETQRVGYAIFDRKMRLLAVVELDQRTRPKRRDLARDRWFAGAGIRTVRFQAKTWPSASCIRSEVFAPGAVRLEPYVGPPSTCMDKIPFPRLRTPWRNTAHLNP